MSASRQTYITKMKIYEQRNLMAVLRVNTALNPTSYEVATCINRLRFKAHETNQTIGLSFSINAYLSLIQRP